MHHKNEELIECAYCGDRYELQTSNSHEREKFCSAYCERLFFDDQDGIYGFV